MGDAKSKIGETGNRDIYKRYGEIKLPNNRFVVVEKNEDKINIEVGRFNSKYEYKIIKQMELDSEETELVTFKSCDEYFKKEKEGLKPNTFRICPPESCRDITEEERFEKLKKFEEGVIPRLDIKIVNADSGETFRRKVKDVTYFDPVFVISWEHPENQEGDEDDM